MSAIGSIPKTRFVCWLVARQSLKTKDKLFRLGVVVDDLCPLCGLETETVHHLFFNHPFSQLCVEAIKQWIGITLKPFELMDFRKRHISKATQHVCILVYACTVYHIWRCRNEAVWYALVRPPNYVRSKIRHDIIQRCLALNLMGTAAFL